MKVVVCPNCNQQASSLAAICPHCGKPITSDASAGTKYRPPSAGSGSGMMKKLVWLVIVAAIAAGAWMLFMK